MHDFRAKLSDPSVAPLVESYLRRARSQRGLLPPSEAAGVGGPISINLDLTLACDYRCGHCIDAELLNGGRHLPLDVVVGTLDVLAARGLRSVILIGGGEPTLHPFFDGVVSAVKQWGLGCAIVTNGAHIDKIAEVARLLTPPDWVRLSLDAGTDGTFQALHRPRKPIRLEQICESAAALKQQAPHLQLGFSFVVMWSSAGQMVCPAATNVHEIPVAAELAKAHAFDYISLKPMLARNAQRAEVVNLGQAPGPVAGAAVADAHALDEIREGLRAAQALADSRFRIVPSRNLLAMLEGLALERSALQPRECHMQQFRQVITPDGIYACPAHRGNARSHITGPAGYATPAAFQESTGLSQLQIRTFNAAVECRQVTCIYNDSNWWLEDLVESGDPVQHLAAPDFFL